MRIYNFNSAGNFAVGTIEKKDGKWIEMIEGASGDGKHFSGVSILTVGDDRNTCVWDETQQVLGGEKTPDFSHEWKRVKR
jgi:hypothetical protein